MSIPRSFIKHNPLRVLAALLVATLLGTSAALIGPSPASALSYNRWAIDVNSIKVTDAQEEHWYYGDNGDEIQLGLVAFHTVLGSKGTTQAWQVGHMQTICTGVYDGRTCSVSDSIGRVPFGYLRQVSATDLARGVHPTVVGTIQVAIEDDYTKDSTVDGIMQTLATITDEELTAASEGLSDADLSSPSKISARFKAAAQRVQDRAQLRWWEKAKIWFKSFGNPDDFIDFKITALVAVENSLADYVDGQLNGALGDDGFAGALRTRSVTHRHAGDGAVYYPKALVSVY